MTDSGKQNSLGLGNSNKKGGAVTLKEGPYAPEPALHRETGWTRIKGRIKQNKLS